MRGKSSESHTETPSTIRVKDERLRGFHFRQPYGSLLSLRANAQQLHDHSMLGENPVSHIHLLIDERLPSHIHAWVPSSCPFETSHQFGGQHCLLYSVEINKNMVFKVEVPCWAEI